MLLSFKIMVQLRDCVIVFQNYGSNKDNIPSRSRDLHLKSLLILIKEKKIKIKIKHNKNKLIFFLWN